MTTILTASIGMSSHADLNRALPETVVNVAPVAYPLVEAELARASLLHLPFSPPLEARYEADTRIARAWNIRLTVPMGLIAYLAFTLVDGSLLPDLGWIPLLLRLFIVFPVGLFAMWICTRFGAAFREAFISVAITGTMMIPVGFIAVSHAPLAPYTMLVAMLVSMFGNITMRLRFHWACGFTAMTVLSVGVMLWLRTDIPSGIAGCAMIATLTCASFGLVANNQLERAERRSFLLALRERLRSDQLSVDKATLSVLSLVDQLTNLPNRRAFDVRLAELISGRQDGGRSFGLLMIDIDHFKRFNDHYGHPAGDACLAQVAQTLRAALVCSDDVVARYGGEEFAVLLTACGASEAAGIGDTLCRALTAAAIPHLNRGDGEDVVSISVGVTAAGPGSFPITAAELITAADRNLYSAKRWGRNRIFADDEPAS